MMGHCLLYFYLSASCVFGVICLAIDRDSFRISSSLQKLSCPRKKWFTQSTNGVAMCKRCPICPVGYGLNSKCNLEKDTTCGPCLPGTFSHQGARYCKKCRICKKREITVRKCTKEHDTKCRKCQHGRFLHKKQRCKKCKCRPGYYVYKKCSSLGNSECKRCPRGMFSSAYSLNDTCVPCRVCDDNFTTIRPCTRKMDTLCSSCQTGYFTHKTTGECSQCQECRTDFPGYTIWVEECSRNNNDSNRHCMSLVPLNTITKDRKANVKKDQRLLSLFMKFVIGGSALILLAVGFAFLVIIVNHRKTMKSIEKNRALERYCANNIMENTANWVLMNCYLADGIRSSSAPSVYLSYEVCDDHKKRSHSFSTSKYEERY